MDNFLIKYLFINSLFYILSILVHKVRSENWRIEPQPTIKFLKIDNIPTQLLLIIFFGFIIFVFDLILKNKNKL